jgi:phage I-like protein
MNHLLTLSCKDLNGVVPEEIQVIPYGIKVNTPKGPFTCDEESAASIIADFEAHKNQMVIDYEHQTLQGTEAPAAGWITKLIDKGNDGIWAIVNWTDKAKQYLINKEYKYVSPVVALRKLDSKVVRLINVALTNQPNIDGMVPLVNKSDYLIQNENKEDLSMKALLKLLGLSDAATEQEAILAVNKLMDMATSSAEKVVANKQVLAALGLPETSTEQGVIEMITTLKTPGTIIVANKHVLEALGLKETATEAEVTGTIMAMKQSHTQVGTLAQELADMKKTLGAKDAAEVVALAMKEGKITPAQKEWADKYANDDLEGFKVFVAKAPVVIRLGKIIGDDKPVDGALDETQVSVNKLMGVDVVTFKKYDK